MKECRISLHVANTVHVAQQHSQGKPNLWLPAKWDTSPVFGIAMASNSPPRSPSRRTDSSLDHFSLPSTASNRRHPLLVVHSLHSRLFILHHFELLRPAISSLNPNRNMYIICYWRSIVLYSYRGRTNALLYISQHMHRLYYLHEVCSLMPVCQSRNPPVVYSSLPNHS